MVNATLTSEQQQANNAVYAWIKEQQRRGCGVELFVSGLALLAGLAAVFVTFCVFSCVSLVFAPILTMRASLWWPLGITLTVDAVFLIDSLFSRRDDLSNVTLWLLRETVGVGPRLLVECVRGLRRANRLAGLDARMCAEVLARLAMRRRSVPREELLRAFPKLDWSRLKAQLSLFPGVLFLRADYSRVSLTEPLRQTLRRVLGPHARYHVEPEPEPQPKPAAEPSRVEPETLTPHEILGVSPGATWAEIKAAYRNRVKECHPDRFVDLDPASRQMAEEWTKNLNAAYATLEASRGQVR